MDLDDELFSLAAGRSKPAKKRGRKAADSDEEEEYVDSEADSEEAPKRKRAAKGGSRKSKKVQSEEEEDDDDDFSDDPDGLFENEEDRKRLMAMTMLDREMILSERAEKRDKERQRMQLLQQQRAATAKADKGKKQADKGRGGKAAEGKAVPRSKAARTAAAARTARDWSDEEASDGGGKSSDEEEEFQPSASSSEDEEEEAAAEASDEEDGEAAEAEPSGRRSGDGRGAGAAAAGAAPSAAGAPAAGADEEEERGAAGRAAARERRQERLQSEDDEAPEEATLDELLSCQVTRNQLEDWVAQPFFERDALSGCVVRMAYGPGQRDATGATHPGYMVMEITEIREHNRSYKFGPRSELTHKHLALRDGLGITRVMAMANVSSKPFTDEEYQRYLRHCGRVNRSPITKDEAVAAAKKVHAAANYRWTSADLKAELERKRASRAAPVNPAAEKAMLKRKLDLAIASGNTNEAAQLEEQLQWAESHLLQQGMNSRSFGMMDINKRNKQHNLTVAYKTTAAEEHGGAGDSSGGGDVFSRRATTQAIYWNTKGGRKGDDQDGPSAGAAAAAKANALISDKLTRAQQRMDPVELLKQLGLSVDVSLLRGVALAPSVPQRVLGSKWRAAALAAHRVDLAGKSVLTIADWKRRAGDY